MGMDLPSDPSPEERFRAEIGVEFGEVRELMGIAETLGFIPTAEMSSLREQIARLSRTTEARQAIPKVGEFQRLAAEVIDKMPDGAPGDTRRHATAQIGREVAVGAIWHQAGETGRALESLQDAAMYADNLDADHLNMEAVRSGLYRLIGEIEKQAG
jgi:hypothetical protein